MGIFDEALAGIQQRLSSFSGPQAKSPFGQVMAPASPFGGTTNTASPFAQGKMVESPFNGPQAVRSPFGNSFGVRSPFGGQQGLSSPFGQNAFSGFAFQTPQAIQAQQQAQLNGNNTSPGNSSGSGSSAGATGIQGDEIWGRIDQFSPLIDSAAQEAGIDGDVFRAIMYNESNGVPTAHNSIGASGLLQLMPSVWQGRGDPFDPATNLKLGAELMKEKVSGVKAAYAKNGVTVDERTFARDLALAWAGHFDYATGRPNPNSSDVLFGQTAAQLSDIFLKHYDAVKAARATRPATGGNSGVSGNMASITPGVGGQIMQEFGPTEYAQAHPSTYAYGNAYGLAGSQHPGVDWAVARGTRVASPLSGTVSVVGNDHGTGYYYTDTTAGGARDGAGEYALTLDNGDILILGHMSRIDAKVGQRINAGDFIGLSGGSDGDHVHVEYRKKNANGGYTIVDPRQYLK